MTDPAYDRTREEEQQWRTTRDPIGIYEKKLLDLDLATQAEFDENDARAIQAAEDAAEYANNSPDPTLDELNTDVMVDNSTSLFSRYKIKYSLCVLLPLAMRCEKHSWTTCRAT